MNPSPTLRAYGWYAVEVTAHTEDFTDPALPLEEIDRHELAEQLHEMADMLTQED
ncbi:hypothetical protein [Brachybacterium kimchii]|uniref:Uncharacterized protein n=1 Tax=Brachybacterium kimchii TaxID=2942909 RepID=A0ABY4NCC6_9MICO|nr:hypothetical protein [Brachybacterium kimchii]UQN31824.1 hypothetical protein M4486_19735 [Brachybacterium kimchii]